MRGWLADYTIDEILEFFRRDVPFPCHMTMGESLTVSDLDPMIRAGDIMICRGYLEMMKKSCKLPFGILAEILPDITVSNQAMTTWEFAKHHTI